MSETSVRGETQVDAASIEAKNFYSAGSSFTTLGCTAAVSVAWGMLARLLGVLGSQWVPFVLSTLIVYAYAYVLPEPPGYAHAGKLRLTAPEAIFGFFNVMIVFATVIGIRESFGFR